MAVRATAAAPGKHPLAGLQPDDGPSAGVIARKASGAAPESVPRAADRASGELASTAAGSGGQPMAPDTRARMEALFRADFSAVRIHEDGSAAALGAHAYTQGSDIHFAPGQYQPDSPAGRELLGHELTHVVQQARGAVPTTVQARGVDLNDDPALEREADELGARVARGEPATTSGGRAAIGAGAGGVAQRKPVPTHYGTFNTSKFAKDGTAAMNCVMTFDPDPTKVNARKIGLSQAVKVTRPDGSHTGIDPTTDERRVRSGTGSDFVLDRVSRNDNPILGADDLARGVGLDKTAADDNYTTSKTKVALPSEGGNARYELGFAYSEDGHAKHQPAAMYDRPDILESMAFETVALALEGADKGTYLGSVKWGFDRKDKDVELHDIELASMGTPTQRFLAAAGEWNKHKTLGTLEVTANPAKVHKHPDMSNATLAKGTKLLQRDKGLLDGKQVLQVQLADQTAETDPHYWVNFGDVVDRHDGEPTIPLPTPKVYVNAAVIALYKDPARKTKLQDLPANTRMEVTASSPGGSYAAKIVDQGDTGLSGYVEAKLVKQES